MDQNESLETITNQESKINDLIEMRKGLGSTMTGGILGYVIGGSAYVGLLYLLDNTLSTMGVSLAEITKQNEAVAVAGAILGALVTMGYGAYKGMEYADKKKRKYDQNE